jgi:beta-lactamase regulating signal transducer with metallopeptidase domain/HEAT repeat protein
MTSMTLAQLGFAHPGATSVWILVAKATIILMAALAVTLVMQRASAGARHLVWLVTLGSLLLVPAVAAWAPIRIALLPAPTAQADISAPLIPVSTRNAIVTAPGKKIAIVNSAPTNTSAAVSASAGTAAEPAWRRVDALTVLLLVWAAVAFAIMASLAGATLALRRIVRGSQPVVDESWLAILWDICDRFGLDEAPVLLRSEETQMPFACGVLKPTIVLPADCDNWTLDRRRAVLLHELAHVTRHDLLGHTLGRLVSAVYWFHPLVWTAAKRLRSESERACDDLALSCGTVAADYAEHLLDIVTSVRRERTPAVALAMARRKEFEGRMLAILDPELTRAKPGRWKLATLVGSLGVLSVLVGAVSPTVRKAAAATRQTASAGSVMPAENLVAAPAAAHIPAAPAPSPSAMARTGAAPRVVLPRTVNLNSVTQSTVSTIADALIQQVQASTLSGPAKKGVQGSPDDRAEILTKVLRTDTSASIRKVAAWGLAEYADSPGVAPALANAVGHDADPNVRETAAWSLSRADESPAVISALTTALRHDADARVRSTSAWSLGTLGDAASLGLLAEALSDPSPEVVQHSAWAIGKLQPEHPPRGLMARLSDHDSQVRVLAAWALFRIHDAATVPALEAALQSEQNKDVQLAEIRAIAEIASANDSSLAIMRKFLDSPDERIKSMAVEAIAGKNPSGPWPWPWPWPRPTP